jgi:hypothetical protein
MRKHAVIFMLIMSLIAACLLAGCAGRGDSSHTPSSQGEPSSEEASGESNGASTTPSSGAPSGEVSNESAVSDWGTAGNYDASTTSNASAASTFSQVLVDRENLYFAIRDVK